MWEMTTHRLQWTQQAQQTAFRRVEWSPDGTRIASGGNDSIVYLWDARDGKQQQLLGHHSGVNDVAWSAEGSRLASCGGEEGKGELFVWDVQIMECERTLEGHLGVIYTIAWSVNGDLLISGDSKGILRWWKVQSGECVRVREAHQGTVQSLRRSPDGRSLASCGDDGAIRIWDLQSTELLRTLRRDRPYERLNITGIRGLTEAQKTTLRALGAVEDTSVSST
jgi:WD40 repeat protein